MAIKRKTITIAGFIVAALFLTALLISFSTDRWVESTEDSGFVNMGLWSVCFDQYKPPPWALVDKYMDNCFWTLDKELDDYDYLFPSWFVATQVLVTLSLVFGFIGVILMVINAINCFPYYQHRDFIRLAMCIAAFCLHFLIVILLTIAVIMFGNHASNDRHWLERPDNNYLSWSYGMCVLADFLALIVGLCLALEFFRIRLELGLSKEPNVYLTNVPPPANSSYRYSRENIPAATANQGIERRQPMYTKRFEGSQNSLPSRTADSDVFKVSGSGQLYINRLADKDEARDRQTYAERGRPAYATQRTDQQAYSTRTNEDRADNRNRSHLANGKAGYGDYEESKRSNQPVLPEYVPKSKSTMEDVRTEDSDLDDIPKKDLSDDSESEEDIVEEKTKSKKKNKTSSSDTKKKKKSRSSSDKRKSKKKSRSKYDDDDDDYDTYLKRKSKRRAESSDDERPRSRKRSKDRASKRKSSRSRSRDLNESYSDVQLDSDRESTRGRTRRKKRSGSKNRSPSDDRLASSGKSKRNTSKDKPKRKSRYDEDYSDDMSGSEYSSRQKTKPRTGRGRDFSDTETVRSKTRRKPELSYSSYYEY